ncbi:Bax inhibitor-1/YccA family protein [Halobacillus kuroshimensis]|uniref:Bax inhibitor-1/YccA family protein n=1 Tax=Halobacillus kuroshimensis TaxID=302481 RepID=A0ABS3DXX9_9BACI|nr:Bax inhibitor-1/YccA family protein [Halobacillus kuroshimensis]MBN8236212.1 Bax inhibitor-1/YccA family protein [Halobacillus kuroshimensis]
MRTSNPILKTEAFQSSREQGKTMTLGGTIAKIAVLFLFLLGTAGYTWYQYAQGADVTMMMLIGAVGGLIFALVTAFIPKAAPITAPIYAALEGFLIGGLSAYAEGAYSGIVIQAVSLTLAVMAALLFLYAARIIKVTRNFRLMVVSATLGILLVYLVQFILQFFGMEVPYLHSSGPIGIGISLFITAIAALNLVLDFDFIEQGVERGAPKHMEWYGAFGLIVTLVWLYIEILRLLQKIRR